MLSGLWSTLHWVAYVYLVNDEVTARFARWAVDVWGVTPTGKTDRTVAEEGIDRYVDFLRRVGAPLTLSEAGVPDDPSLSRQVTPIMPVRPGRLIRADHRDDARVFSRLQWNRCRSDGWSNPVI